MSAVVKINRLTGTSPTLTDITRINTRMGTFDSHTTSDTAHPIDIPGSGTSYSYWASTQLHCTVAPTGLIDNIKLWTIGADLSANDTTLNVAKASSYVQATGTTGVTGDELNGVNYSSLTYGPVDASGFTSPSSGLSISGSTTTTGLFGDIVVLQFAVGTSALSGASGQPVIIWGFDETV